MPTKYPRTPTYNLPQSPFSHKPSLPSRANPFKLAALLHISVPVSQASCAFPSLLSLLPGRYLPIGAPADSLVLEKYLAVGTWYEHRDCTFAGFIVCWDFGTHVCRIRLRYCCFRFMLELGSSIAPILRVFKYLFGRMHSDNLRLYILSLRRGKEEYVTQSCDCVRWGIILLV